MTYAANAIIQHEYEGTTLFVWISFHLPMKLSSDPLATPPVFDVKPPDAKWIVYLDEIETAITSSEWLDLYTMLLTIEAVASEPDKVSVKYDGPDPNLRTSWDKQWEPWALITSYTGWPTTFKAGMIILWSGSVVSIPSGWHLCDGTEGTPNLRNRFLVGAGQTYSPGASGGNVAHTHTLNISEHDHPMMGGTGIAAGDDVEFTTDIATPLITEQEANHLPPYYSLCYIMKL